MARNYSSIAKITRPSLPEVYPRERLFRLLDEGRKKPIIWLSGPAGSGKTTLAASYLDARTLPSLWYQVDERDADIATFFYYMGLAAKKAAPRRRAPLPLLTPEYLGGIPAFTKRYFENLYSRLNPSSPPFDKGGHTGGFMSKKGKGGFVIVFDNYQDAPSDSGFQEMIVHGLEALPAGVTALILSRNEPPSLFSRLRANDKMQLIGWDEIRLTMDESREIIRLKERWKPTDEVLAQLYKKTQGWVAGLVLMTEASKIKDIDPQSLSGHAPGEIFDYFANEIFKKTDKEIQTLLLKTAFLHRIPVKLVEELTGISRAGKILSSLCNNHYFTEKHSPIEPVYQYHPLFREFLLSRAKETFSQADISGLQRESARLLEEAGLIEDAVELYAESKEWEELVRLILKHAPSFATQGRGTTLEKWLNALPDKIRENEPWLAYWMGVCRQPFNPSEARLHFEKAFSSFRRREDTVGTFLSWSGTVESILYEWNDFTPLDRWIEQLDGFMQSKPSFPSPEIEIRVASSMTAALMIRQPWRPDLAKWLERALCLARSTSDTNLRIQTLSYAANYYGWIGDLSRVMVVMEEIRRTARSSEASPLVKITWLWLETALSITSGVSPDSAVRQISEALDLSRTTGVHVWDHMLLAMGVYASLIQNDLETAGHYLTKKEGSLRSAGDSSHYHYLSSWYHFLKEDISRAATDASEALRLAEQTGYLFPVIQCRHGMAYVLHERGMLREAKIHIGRANALADRTKSMQHRYAYLLAKARLAFDEGMEKAGLGHLAEAFRIGRENGYFYLLWWFPPKVMGSLCVKALENGIETRHVRELIRKCGFVSYSPPVNSESWPFPLRIYTLGRFEIVRDDKPVAFSGKVQKRPLDMLKATIAFGEAGAAYDQMTDALWPDAEGDAASSTFKSNLHRLRKVMGRDDAFRLQEGRLRLDSRQCWVDAWAFEKLINEAENRGMGESEKMQKTRGRDGRSSQVSPLSVSPFHNILEKALSLYRGHFLEGDREAPWAVSYRERLRKKHVRAVMMLGQMLEQAGDHAKAVRLYERGIEVDSIAEELYCRLMTNLGRLGRKAEALSVYERCRKTLHASFGVGPSEDTETLRRRIRES